MVVTAGAFEASDAKRGPALTARDVLTTAGALGDVTGALNALPGTTRVGEEGKLFVRGGAAAETKQYLDGLPVQSPYAGAVPNLPARGRFAPLLFKGLVFSTGGYSAEYGQALSAVVALNSTDLAPETQTGVSLMSVGGSLSHVHRWARASLAASADYANLGPYFRLVPQGQAQAYETRGGAARLAQQVGRHGLLKIYGTFAQQTAAARPPDPAPEYAAQGRAVALANANQYFNATYRGPLRRGWSLNTGLALTRDDNDVRPGALVVRDVEQSAVARLVLTNDSASAWFNLKVGAEGLAQRYRQTYRPDPAAGVPGALRTGFDEQRGAAFAESELVLSHRLAGRAGARAEYSALLGRGNAAPRLALAYRLGPHGQLAAAGGYFYQTPANDLLRFTHDLRFERAQHLQLSYERAAAGRTLRGELYQKTYAQLVTYDPANYSAPSAYRNGGRGYARGLDVFWRDRTSLPRLDYWVSYGYLATVRQYRADPVPAVPTFAARHALSVVAKYWVPRLHTQFGATAAYNSPRAYHDPNRPGYNQGRTPSYQDLSLSASYLTHVFGQYTIVNVAASNVLSRANTYGYRYAAAPDARGQYAGVALTPSAPRMLFVGVFVSINKKAPGSTEVAPD
ncbi:MAG: TonB-dependent receptor plug domain-containing protein [Janthinobacterium lividum]